MQQKGVLTSAEPRQKTMPLFFIVGVGRSGTTLLMSMLNAHPLITTPPETHFVRKYIVRNRRVRYQTAVKLLHNDKEFTRIGFAPELIIQEGRHFDSVYEWKNVYQRMLTAYLKNCGKQYIGDKDPKLIEHIPTLHRYFPTSKVIHVVRDPRDVFLSRQKAGWSRDRHWMSHPIAYKIQFGIGHRLGKELFEKDYIEIQYENLVSKPEATLQRLCRFLGLDYSQQMLSFAEKANELVADDEKDWKKNVAGPLLSNNFNKWRGNLTRSQLVCIEGICKEAFHLGLYEQACPPLSRREHIRLVFCELMVWVIDNLYRLRLRILRN